MKLHWVIYGMWQKNGTSQESEGWVFGTVKYKNENIMYMNNKNTPVKSIPRTWTVNNHLNDICEQLCVDLYKQQDNKQTLWF